MRLAIDFRLMPSSGRSRRWYLTMAIRASSSGNATKIIRSNRPGLRSAASTSHGWLVAPRT
ncbi:Uncharacterised protein [Mycobacteroides abscessus subsp. abscessus]|nr:Uncharacterised protein [Mycobacteroides abscessus subsp. abscessus]